MNGTLEVSQAALIRGLNDRFRRTFIGGRIVLTPGIMSFPASCRAKILSRIANFNDFNDGNDPHEEHDFIAFHHTSLARQSTIPRRKLL